LYFKKNGRVVFFCIFADYSQHPLDWTNCFLYCVFQRLEFQSSKVAPLGYIFNMIKLVLGTTVAGRNYDTSIYCNTRSLLVNASLCITSACLVARFERNLCARRVNIIQLLGALFTNKAFCIVVVKFKKLFCIFVVQLKSGASCNTTILE
jgi:hypothetical protein